MPRGRSPDSYKAEELYKQGMRLVEIASQLNVSEGTVRSWKNRYNFENKSSATLQKNKCNVAKEKHRKEIDNEGTVAYEVKQVMKNPKLTDKQRLFCIYYVRCFNATKAYQKAYGCTYEVANSEGYKLLVNPCIRAEIDLLKQNRLNREFLDEYDIFQKYVDIAFADITDFVEFGRETIPVMGAFGPIEIKDEESGDKIKLTKEVNIVKFKDFKEVDGTIITEVKQGRDGASIKLADRMKALDWLTEHMNLATTEQRARIEQIKANTDRLRRGYGDDEDDEGVEIINDAPQTPGSDIRHSDSKVPTDI